MEQLKINEDNNEMWAINNPFTGKPDYWMECLLENVEIINLSLPDNGRT
jgi:hypothetical protein